MVSGRPHLLTPLGVQCLVFFFLFLSEIKEVLKSLNSPKHHALGILVLLRKIHLVLRLHYFHRPFVICGLEV